MTYAHLHAKKIKRKDMQKQTNGQMVMFMYY